MKNEHSLLATPKNFPRKLIFLLDLWRQACRDNFISSKTANPT